MPLGSIYSKDILNCSLGPRDVTGPDILLTMLLCNPIILKNWNPSLHCAALYFFPFLLLFSAKCSSQWNRKQYSETNECVCRDTVKVFSSSTKLVSALSKNPCV